MAELEALGKEFNQYKKESVKWSWEDIKIRAKCHDVELTQEQCQEILENMIRHHDASLGITWDTIDAEIDYYREKHKI